MNRLKTLVAVAAVPLAACSSMSGYDAKTDFGCKAPEGVLCESMSGIYANAMANNLPGQRVNQGGKRDDGSAAASQGTGVITKPVHSGTPIRTAPLVLRVWFAPWEDSDGDLHDQSYVYLPVDNGRWLIEHNRRRIQDAYRPVRAPSVATGAAASPQDKGVKPSATGADASDTQRQVATPQTAQEMLNGLLRPGMPGSPAQAGDTE